MAPTIQQLKEHFISNRDSPQVDEWNSLRQAVHYYSQRTDLVWFVKNIMRASYPHFIWSEMAEDVCRVFWEHPRVMMMAFRGAGKTDLAACLMAKVVFDNWGDQASKKDIFVGSLKPEMARRRTKRLKDLIQANPYFQGIIDRKQAAESILSYTWPGNAENERNDIYPFGVKRPPRGDHPYLMLIDDALGDVVDNLALDPLEVQQILQTIKEGIDPMTIVNTKHYLFIGTPQNKADPFHDEEYKSAFHFKSIPARKTDGKPVCPERFSDETLTAVERRGRRSWMKEWMMVPPATADSLLSEEEILSAISDDIAPARPGERKFAGWDPAEKVHNSVFTIAVLRDGVWEQLFLKRWRPGTASLAIQFQYVCRVMAEWGITKLRADGSMGEFTIMKQNRQLPRGFEIVKFTKENKGGYCEDLAYKFDSTKAEGQTIRY